MPSALIVKPVRLPVGLLDVKAHLRYEDTDQDDYILSLISSATAKIEAITGRALITQEWIKTYDSWPCVFDGFRTPLQSVLTINYIDSDGTNQTLGPEKYIVETVGYGRVSKAYNTSWPVYRAIPSGISITYKCGYGDKPTDVPSDIIAALKLLVGHWFENREAVVIGSNPIEVPLSVDYLLEQYRSFY